MVDRELIEIREGKEIYLYPDGSKRDSRGSWVEKPPGAAPLITSDNASEYAERKWELYQDAFREGAIKATNGAGEHEAIVRISTAQTQLSLDTEKGHASTKAAEYITRAAGWMRPRDQGPMVTINQVVLPPGIEKLMLSRMVAVSDAGSRRPHTGTDGET